MAQPTVKYKRTLQGSIGAGMKSLAGGDRRFYVLEHKITTRFHKAGEQQTIIVDQIELGRDPKCQVRFDDSFTTVSRRHAAIVREGDNWKLVQLSQTNSTFLNGRQVTKEWYLQNGDEIQLSVNGPKLGFNIPAGDKGMVKSLRLTTRLNLFRQQALRPYKRAMAIMALVFVGALGAMGAWNYQLQNDLVAQSRRLAEQITAAKGDAAKLDSLRKELIKANAAIADQESKLKKVRGSINTRSIATASAASLGSDRGIESVFSYVYYVECYLHVGDKVIPGWSGTGFQLDNGYFVTAQHVIHFDGHSNDTETLINALYNAGEATIIMVATSSHDSFKIEYSVKNMPFRLGHVKTEEGTITLEDGTTWVVREHKYAGSGDWAILRHNRKGGIPHDSQFSRNMPIQTKLHILGFPANQGVTKGGTVSPVYSTAVTARQGLEDDGTIKTANDNSDHGNSGGPVLVNRNGKYVVVGVLSGATKGSDSQKGRVVPIGSAL